jgi:uncharacterized protein
MHSIADVNDIAELLLVDSPDVPQLIDDLAASFSFSHDEALQFIRRTAWQINATMFPPITHMELVLTEGCNLACTYCFEKNMLGYRRMPLHIAKAAVDLLFAYSRDAQTLQITHFGGEPTLNFEAIRAVTEYAEELAADQQKTLEFNTTSNGTLLTESMVDYFVQHRIMVLISLDGLARTNDRFRVDKRGLGTFDRVMAGLQLLKERQTWVGVKITVMPENASCLVDDVKGLNELGVNQFLIGHATGIDWPANAIQTFGEQLGQVYAWYQENKGPELKIAEFDEAGEGRAFFGCQAGRNSIAVSVDGELSPCSKILALDNKKLLAKLGDVNYGLTHLRNRSELVTCSRLTSACHARNIAAEYQGGCFASNYSAHQDLYMPNLQDHQFSILNRSICAGCSAAH